MTMVELSQLLASQKITSRQLVEQALAAIKDPQGEGSRTFLSVHESEALAAADQVDAQRRAGAKLPALAGIPISIKDLFDEAGVTTLGGSKVLVGTAPATRDSSVVERLKKAGTVIIGRTNLVEFAYSGLGINPHYGTPKNAFDRATGRIPGGSSSGAAISVTDGMAAGAIGTDTGGSIRIPAALNGLVGFKPTARRVPLDGVLPLSFTLDSAGPIAKSVADCALLDQVLAAEDKTFQRLPICAACVSRCPARCSRTTCRQRSPTPSGRLSPACRPPARPWSSFPWPNSPKPRPSTREVR
jgi:aspartyl-tRNA(Asn)/glutamyl-tRNA(Gln) amidotransferase subunit A